MLSRMIYLEIAVICANILDLMYEYGDVLGFSWEDDGNVPFSDCIVIVVSFSPFF